METWKLPDKIKILEALGAVVDGRLKVNHDNQTATCKSSDLKQEYNIKFDLKNNAITSDDNSAHWQGRLGYPAIAVLMELGELPQNDRIAEVIKDLPWKEVNTQFKNDLTKTMQLVYEIAKAKNIKEVELNHYMDQVMEIIVEKSYKNL